MKEETAEYLVRQYSDTVLRIAYTWLGNMDDAKDILQIAVNVDGIRCRAEDMLMDIRPRMARATPFTTAP